MTYVTGRTKHLYAVSLEVLNDLEGLANTLPGLSGAVVRDWLGGERLAPGADSYLLPEHAALGQAVEELRRISQRLARVYSLAMTIDGQPQER